MGGRVTHAVPRVRRHGRRSGPADPSAGSGGRRRTGTRRRNLVRLLLVMLFGMGLATLAPGVAQAEGEQVTGTVQTSRSGPIPDVQIEVTTPDGEEIDSVETDEDGRWAVDLPGPGQYVVTLDEGDLPEGVSLAGEDSRTVTVDEGR